MDGDDLIYLLLLLFTIVLGDGIRRIENSQLKQYASTLAGIVICFLVSGVHICHAIVETAINAIIICYLPSKFIHGLSFLFSFSYLLFFRFATSFGISQAPPHTNAVQMLLTLKMVGLALEVSETAKMKKQIKQAASSETDVKTDIKEVKLTLEHTGVSPNIAEVFHYAFCYIGFLTGPYFKYRTYVDMVHAKNAKISHLQHALQRLKMLPAYALLFLVSGFFFPLSYAKSEEIFTEHSLLYRIWYMTPLFFTFRMRFYSGFILSEVACIMAGLGAYPVESQPKPGHGPTALQHLTKDKETVQPYNFETIHNIDEYAAEFYDVRGSLKSWNMTVQFWLATNVHRRFPLKAFRTTVTMLTSAFWHGVHSGYYLSMLTVPFILLAEDAAKRKFRTLNPRIFDLVAGFMKIQWFSYMGVAFSLLAMETTLNYWKSIYFIGHVVIVLVYVGSRMTPSPKQIKD